jgi:hypothetical protein
VSRQLLVAKLRKADIDASAGAADEIARVIARIRARWPKVRIILRADSGFAREELMAWCESSLFPFRCRSYGSMTLTSGIGSKASRRSRPRASSDSRKL